ncbi:trans-2-enoyl-CoA reductase family protein [Clostridium sp. P21]|uniref:Trans-2-enoyl-CoA reductase [NADH] n=1 Tax=Clostridium muellerianum TaxID=2716538 RepID=A0A7Y0ENX0_9CLOT|nr:enoyl-ACP reductase FabV [Clostridium muellerianum]NMM65800.1 trans-2-enoyl-CoA reductase family protein [Clostridium muellerianum]
MIIKPKFKNFICTTAHPEGCSKNVKEQIDYVKKLKLSNGPKKALIIGASTGYGLASRIVSTFAAGASTIGVIFAKPASETRTAGPGFYNTAAFEKEANKAGYYCKTINKDAFSKEAKDTAIELIKKDLGKIDLVIYSLASPRRVHPETGETFHSVIKPIGEIYKNKTVNFHNYKISDVEINPANKDEIQQTITVMGGDDWKLWIDSLSSAGVLSEGAVTVAYSYIGPELTYPIYRQGTIGKAKEHLEATASVLDNQLKKINGKAFVSVNKALVTQSSSAIPVVPLYISALYKIMKEKGIHEGCIEQIYRLFSDKLYGDDLRLDGNGRIRLDDLEMQEDVQKSISDIWNKITTENVAELTNIDNFKHEFFKLFGFEHSDIDYDKDVSQYVELTNHLE